jgi:hypothetical protein
MGLRSKEWFQASLVRIKWWERPLAAIIWSQGPNLGWKPLPPFAIKALRDAGALPVFAG